MGTLDRACTAVSAGGPQNASLRACDVFHLLGILTLVLGCPHGTSANILSTVRRITSQGRRC